MFRKIIPVAIILAGLILLAFSFAPAHKAENIISENQNLIHLVASTTQVGQTAGNVPSPTKATSQQPEKIIPVKNNSAPAVKTIAITLAVRNATSTLEVPENSSVYQAMTILASTTSFTFHSIYYEGMGYYIDAINGEKNRNNAFWIYYVNNQQADLGISLYILKNNDTIRWRLEDSAKKEVGIE